MFCLHGLGVRKKTVLKNGRHYTISSVVRKQLLHTFQFFCSASGVKIYYVNLDHETTFLT